MKVTVETPTELDVKWVSIEVPVRHGDEEIPYDFPFRSADSFSITVNADTGEIEGWPAPRSGFNVFMKVVDCGTYKLYGESEDGRTMLATIEQGYVPHGVVPGEYGDYIDLHINRDGVITNWPKEFDVSEFFPEE